MKCKVQVCKEQTKSKTGYCKIHLAKRKEFVEIICLSRHYSGKGYTRKDIEQFSFAGLSQHVEAILKYDKTIAGEWRKNRLGKTDLEKSGGRND